MDRKARSELLTKAQQMHQEVHVADLQMRGSLMNAGQVGMADCAPAAPREFETPLAILRLGGLVERLHATITDLSVRLDWAMKISKSEGECPSPPEPESELARQIDRQATQVLVAAKRLEEILERLEI